MLSRSEQPQTYVSGSCLPWVFEAAYAPCVDVCYIPDLTILHALCPAQDTLNIGLLGGTGADMIRMKGGYICHGVS